MSDKGDTRDDATPERLWGFIMGLTGAYLLLVEQLRDTKAIDTNVTIEKLQTLHDSLTELPDAQNWLDVTIKQIKSHGDEK